MRILLVFLLVFIVACTSNKENNCNLNSEKIIFYAAAGAKLVTDEICNQFENQFNIKVERNYASSGTLARQLANGAIGDVFISANGQWIKFLVEKDLLVESSIKKVARNSLVVITNKESEMLPLQFEKGFDIKSAISGNIVIGDPAYVPAGKYTKTVFDALGWTNLIENKTVKTKDVTSVLYFIELGECEWGVVYKSEALHSSKVKIINEIPKNLHDPIIFYIANIKGQKAKGDVLSKMFYSQAGQNVFENYGFAGIINSSIK